MLDEKKVRLMTRMASYEENEGKTDMKISAYYRKDYVSLNTLISVIEITVAYACLIGLIVLGGFDALVAKMSMKLAVTLGVAAVVGYLVALIVYTIVSHRFYDRKHKEARTRVKKFNHDIIRLLKQYGRGQ